MYLFVNVNYNYIFVCTNIVSTINFILFGKKNYFCTCIVLKLDILNIYKRSVNY